MFYFKLAFRNVFRSKGRTAITLAAIAFGSIALIFAGGFIEDSLYQLRESYIHAHLGHLQVNKKGFIEKGASHPFDYLIADPAPVTALISKIPHVKIIAPRLEFSGLLSTGETTVSFIGQGVDPQIEAKMSNSLLLEAGKNLLANDDFQLILGRGLAAAVSVKPGDALVVLTNTLGGSINALDIFVKGIFYTSSKEFDDHALRMPLKTVQKLLLTDGIQTLVILVDKTENTEEVLLALRQALEKNGMDYEVSPWTERSDFYNKLVEFYDKQFGILKIIIAIVSILSIFNTMNMSVLERVGELGTMRAIGTSRRRVIAIFVCEGFVLGLLGGIVGLVGGWLVAKGVSLIGIPMPPPPGATINWVAKIMIVPKMFIQSFVIAIGASLISSFYPAVKASRLLIAEALRHNV